MAQAKQINPIALKRIPNEIKKFNKDPIDGVRIYQNPNNILEVYFLLKGPSDTDYKDGEYIGLVSYPYNYPQKAPMIKMLTPNGRFELNKTICLSNTGYHDESWVPGAWKISQSMIGFISIWDTKVDTERTGVAHIKYHDTGLIKKLAKDSRDFNVSHYPTIYQKLIEQF